MDNIDDLMRHKQNNDDPQGRFQFREEYWEQARVLIEADEARRRKRRRRLIVWWFFSLLTVAAGAAWWGLQRPAQTAASGNRNPVTQETTTSRQNQTENQGSQSAAVATDSFSTNNLNKSQNLGNNTETSKEQVTRGNAANQPPQKSTISPESPAALTHSEPSKTIKSGDSGAISVHSGVDNPAVGNAQPYFKPDALQSPENSISTQKTSETRSIQADSAASAHKSADLAKFLQTLFAIPLPLKEVKSTQEKKVEPRPVPSPQVMATREIKPAIDKKLHVGVSVAAAAFQPARDKKWLGASAGFWGTYALNQRWALSIGLNAKFQPGGDWRLDSSYIVEFYSRRYSYGIDETYTTRHQMGLLTLEIPVGVQWRRGSFGAEAGVGYGKLLAALERLKMQKRDSFHSEFYTVRNRIERGDKSLFAKDYAFAYAGISWRATKKISVVARANYRFGPLLPATSHDAAIKGGSNLELGFRWEF